MPTSPHTYIFMGVSGCGKSTIASAFAESTGGTYLDGDDFHPPANVEKMRSGTPLDDTDRVAWLQSIAKAIRNSRAPILSIACSALKKSHRDVLRSATSDITFIHLHGTRELLASRHRDRSGHFMPASLLDSQLADLETPTDATSIDIASPPDTIVTSLIEKFGL